jgi:hypothetical protein
MNTKQSEDDKFVKRTIKHINDTSKWASNRINELNTVDELCDYMRSKYLDPYDLGGTSIIDEYYKLLESNKITTETDIDNFFKKELKQKDEHKQPKSKKHDISVKKIKKLIDTLESIPKPSKVNKHDTVDSILKTIFDIKDTTSKEHDKPDFTKGNELLKMIESKLKSNKPIRKDMVDRMADLIQTQPEFKTITKNKLKKYGFVIFNNFNKRYPELMNEMFKKEEIEKLLKKKYDKHLKMK